MGLRNITLVVHDWGAARTINILRATIKAMEMAVKGLDIPPDFYRTRNLLF